MKELKIDENYSSWLFEIKSKVKSTQIRAILSANAALIEFYWELGKMIVEKQNQTRWGDKLIEQLSFDLKEEFPDITGLSVRNLKYARQFYQFYHIQIGQQAVAQFEKEPFVHIPWGHNILIFSKSKNVKEAIFYINQTLTNNWSRDILAFQLKSNLFNRIGKAITNFKSTLPEPLSDLAQQTIKDPYIFDILTLSSQTRERDIEKQLITHITHFLLELGKGFAFIGNQYRLEIAGSEYFLDLLFYNIPLKSYVVIELKNTKFIPEYAGKLNFYLSSVDTLLKTNEDKPSIGILLCRDKNNIEVEFSLRDISKPIGVSEFIITETLPDNLKSSLPTVEEIENELRRIEN